MQYATDANLRARQRLWDHQQPPFDLASWVLELAELSPDSTEQTLDVGCESRERRRDPAAIRGVCVRRRPCPIHAVPRRRPGDGCGRDATRDATRQPVCGRDQWCRAHAISAFVRRVRCGSGDTRLDAEPVDPRVLTRERRGSTSFSLHRGRVCSGHPRGTGRTHRPARLSSRATAGRSSAGDQHRRLVVARGVVAIRCFGH